MILTEAVKPADSKHAAQFETSIDLMGKTGTVLTPLRPAGIIEIDGTKYDVISDGVYISSGKRLRWLKSRAQDYCNQALSIIDVE